MSNNSAASSRHSQGIRATAPSDSEARKQLTFRAQNSDYRKLSLDPTA
jgi:hypothetical protein